MGQEINLSGLLHDCGHNIGSVRLIEVVRVEDIKSFPRVVPGMVMSGDIVLFTGKTFETYYFERDTVEYDETDKDDGNGTFYNVSIDGQFHRHSSSANWETAKLKDGHYVVRFTDFNDLTRIAGTPETPLLFRSKQSTNRTRNRPTDYTWKFEGEQNLPSPEFTGNITFEAADNCSLLSMSDFTLSPWQINGDDSLNLIYVLLSGSGLITSIDSYPDGELINPSGGVESVMEKGGGDFYAAASAPLYLSAPGIWTIIIPDIPVTLSTGESCTLTFQQTHEVVAGNQVPVASSVQVTGTKTEGSTLTASYTYFDPDGDANLVASTEAAILWQRYDNSTGSTGQTTIQTGGTTYVVQAADVGKYITATVTPYAVAGPSPGSGVESSRQLIPSLNTAPTLTTLDITGTPALGETLTASYTYDDAEGDTELTSSTIASIEWYRYDAASGLSGQVLIATGAATYVVQAADVGKFLEVRVTPFASTGEPEGLEYQSALVEIVSNAAPVITGQSLSGDFEDTETITLLYSYSDAEGDPQNVSSTEGSIVWKTYDAETGTTGEQIEQSGGTTYTIGTADVGRWLMAEITPHATNGELVGTTVETARYQIIETAYTFIHTKQTGLEITQIGGSGVVDWGDGNTDPFDATNLSVATIMDHDYASPGTYTVTVKCDPANVQNVNLENMSLTSIDISDLTHITTFRVSDNASLTTITNPTSNSQTWATYWAANCALSGTFSLSTLTGLGGDFDISGNPGLTGITNPTSSATFTSYNASNCNLTTFSAANLTGLGGDFDVSGNANLTTITNPTSAVLFSAYRANDCRLTGTLNVSTITFNALVVYNNTLLTGITMPTYSGNTNIQVYNTGLTSLDLSTLTGLKVFQNYSMPDLVSITFPTSSGAFTNFYLYDCDSLTSIDISGLSNISGYIYLYENAACTSITMPSSSGTITRLWVRDCDLTGTFDYSGITLNGSFVCARNPSLTALSPPSSVTYTGIQVFECDLSVFDFTGATLSTTHGMYFNDNGMTAAEVNQILVDLDSKLTGSISNTIDVGGTNDAPDSSSGGNDGSAAVVSLTSKGATVTT